MQTAIVAFFSNVFLLCCPSGYNFCTGLAEFRLNFSRKFVSVTYFGLAV